jgi:hypothetical protein
MRWRKSFVVVLALFLGGSGYAQTDNSTKSQKSSRFRVPRVSRSKALIMCPIFVESKYPYQGIGLKVGDPFALTYKYYPSKHWAFAADGGKAASGLYNRYYRNAFSSYLPDSIKSDTSHSKRLNYLTHRVLDDWFFEAKFLYQWDAQKIAQGLQFYAGLGWQVRSTRIQYAYNYQDGITSVTDSKIGKFNESRFTYGPVALVGFEYSYFTLPISAFIEVEWFTDTLIDPGYQRFQGGVGFRYIF